jgi:hypothetical protein
MKCQCNVETDCVFLSRPRELLFLFLSAISIFRTSKQNVGKVTDFDKIKFLCLATDGADES